MEQRCICKFHMHSNLLLRTEHDAGCNREYDFMRCGIVEYDVWHYGMCVVSLTEDMMYGITRCDVWHCRVCLVSQNMMYGVIQCDVWHC